MHNAISEVYPRLNDHVFIECTISEKEAAVVFENEVCEALPHAFLALRNAYFYNFGILYPFLSVVSLIFSADIPPLPPLVGRFYRKGVFGDAVTV